MGVNSFHVIARYMERQRRRQFQKHQLINSLQEFSQLNYVDFVNIKTLRSPFCISKMYLKCFWVGEVYARLLPLQDTMGLKYIIAKGMVQNKLN